MTVRAPGVLLALMLATSVAGADINALLQHLSEGRYADAAADLEANISRYPRSSDAVGRIALVVCNGRYRIAKDPAGSRILDAALRICESAASGGSEENLRSLAKVRFARAEAAWISGGVSRTDEWIAAANALAEAGDALAALDVLAECLGRVEGDADPVLECASKIAGSDTRLGEFVRVLRGCALVGSKDRKQRAAGEKEVKAGLAALEKTVGDDEEGHQAYNDALTHALRREGLKLKPKYSSKRLHLAFDERPGRTFWVIGKQPRARDWDPKPGVIGTFRRLDPFGGWRYKGFVRQFTPAMHPLGRDNERVNGAKPKDLVDYHLRWYEGFLAEVGKAKKHGRMRLGKGLPVGTGYTIRGLYGTHGNSRPIVARIFACKAQRNQGCIYVSTWVFREDGSDPELEAIVASLTEQKGKR